VHAPVRLSVAQSVTAGAVNWLEPTPVSTISPAAGQLPCWAQLVANGQVAAANQTFMSPAVGVPNSAASGPSGMRRMTVPPVGEPSGLPRPYSGPCQALLSGGVGGAIHALAMTVWSKAAAFHANVDSAPVGATPCSMR